MVQPVPRDRERYPATAAQARLWLDEALADQPGLYTLTFELDLAGQCSPARIEAALNQLVAAWETLRTGLVEDGSGTIWQVVHAPWQVAVADGEDLESLRHEVPRQAFDLGLGRNLRAVLVRIGPDRHRLLLTTHHAFVDGWSFNLLLQDLASALDGKPLPGRALQPVDCATWEQQAGKDLAAADLKWWRRELDPMPAATELAAEGPRGPARSARTELAQHRLDPSVARRMRACARELGVTDFQFCLTAFALLLRAETGPAPLLLGTHVALRDRPGLEALPRMMVNNLPLLLDLEGTAGFAEAAGRVAAAFSAAWQHGHAGFQHIAGLRAGPRDGTRHPLYGIAFTHESMGADPARAGGLTVTPMPAHVARGALDMDLSMADQADGGLLLKAAYRGDLFGAVRVDALLVRLGGLIGAAARDPQASPERLGLDEGEEAASPVAIFDAQAARMPGVAALLDGRGATLASHGDLSWESWRIGRCACHSVRYGSAMNMQSNDRFPAQQGTL